MTTTCKKESMLSALMDDALGPIEKQALQDHVDQCPVCRRKMAGFSMVDQAVRQIPEIEPSAAFNRDFWEKIHAIDAQNERKWSWATWLGNRRSLVSGGLAVGIALGLYLGLSRPDPKIPDINPEVLFMAEHLEMLDDYELVSHLDLLEDWEAINTLEDRT